MKILHFESGKQLFNKGSHIPIIAFIGDASDKSRGAQRYMERDEDAKKKGEMGGTESRDKKRRREIKKNSWNWRREDSNKLNNSGAATSLNNSGAGRRNSGGGGVKGHSLITRCRGGP